METLSITPEIASEDKALKTLLDTFGSVFSLQDIASAFCKAGRNPDLAGQMLCETQTNPSTHELHVSNEPLISRSRSQISEISDSKAPTSKRNAASMGTVSSVLGKNYVWRAAKSNGNLDGTKPLKVDASEFVTPASSNDHSFASKDASSRVSENSSLRKDANMNDDVENFLFEMLGRGFQLERSAIHEVLGRCGYDMKTSLETLLDLTAANLDKQYDVHKESSSRSNSETFQSRNQARNQRIAESSRFGNNGVSSQQLSGRYEQQKEVLTSLFHAPERTDPTVRASVVKSARWSRATERLAAEPLDDLSYEPKVISTRLRLADLKDEADDSPYQILRKAVKEHRNTMKEYYRAATEAFASGDRARATLLLEKGQYFYSKAREADEESATKIFETSSGNDEMQDDMSLDLQDHEAKEAIKLVKCHLRSLSGISSIKILKVMVGNGGREAEKRRRLVIKLLERGDITWTEDETSSTILIRLDEINPENLSFAKK